MRPLIYFMQKIATHYFKYIFRIKKSNNALFIKRFKLKRHQVFCSNLI